MPREVFYRQSNGQNLTDEEIAKKYDDYSKRLELNQRVNEFMKSLPENLTDEERRQVHFEFYTQEKKRLEIK